MITAEHSIQVPFYDVDSMNIVWHGHYIKYFEQARCVLLDKINYNYEVMRESGYSWPVVDVRVKYIKSLTFNQFITVQVKMTECENRLRLDYVIKDKTTEEKLCTGYTIQVAVEQATQELQFILPECFRKTIQAL